MPGTRKGGLKAVNTNKEKYGEDFYKNIGKIGGQNGHTGGFQQGSKLAKEAGRKGGRISKRPGKPYNDTCDLCGGLMTANCNNAGCDDN